MWFTFVVLYQLESKIVYFEEAIPSFENAAKFYSSTFCSISSSFFFQHIVPSDIATVHNSPSASSVILQNCETRRCSNETISSCGSKSQQFSSGGLSKSQQFHRNSKGLLYDTPLDRDGSKVSGNIANDLASSEEFTRKEQYPGNSILRHSLQESEDLPHNSETYNSDSPVSVLRHSLEKERLARNFQNPLRSSLENMAGDRDNIGQFRKAIGHRSEIKIQNINEEEILPLSNSKSHSSHPNDIFFDDKLDRIACSGIINIDESRVPNANNKSVENANDNVPWGQVSRSQSLSAVHSDKKRNLNNPVTSKFGMFSGGDDLDPLTFSSVSGSHKPIQVQIDEESIEGQLVDGSRRISLPLSAEKTLEEIIDGLSQGKTITSHQASFLKQMPSIVKVNIVKVFSFSFILVYSPL